MITVSARPAGGYQSRYRRLHGHHPTRAQPAAGRGWPARHAQLVLPGPGGRAMVNSNFTSLSHSGLPESAVGLRQSAVGLRQQTPVEEADYGSRPMLIMAEVRRSTTDREQHPKSHQKATTEAIATGGKGRVPSRTGDRRHPVLSLPTRTRHPY